MNILAIIPARGGSKGVPRKNVLPLAGKPLLAYNVEAALASRFINRVVISTDDAEIGAVAQEFGADVVWRPAEISGDMASSESALLHVLDHLLIQADFNNALYQPAQVAVNVNPEVLLLRALKKLIDSCPAAS